MKKIRIIWGGNIIFDLSINNKTKVANKDKIQVSSSSDSYDLLKNCFNPNNVEHIESAVLLMLNRANKVLGWAKISSGGITGTVMDPKVIFQLALNTNASNIILSHNHPSGNLKPSQADKEITRQIKKGGDIL